MELERNEYVEKRKKELIEAKKLEKLEILKAEKVSAKKIEIFEAICNQLIVEQKRNAEKEAEARNKKEMKL